MTPNTAIGPRSEADRLLDERAADARLFRRNLVVAAFVFGVSLLVYLAFSLRSFAVPGEAAEALAGLSGARPNLMDRHMVWRGAVSAVLAIAPASCAVAAANLFHAVVSALAVSLLYLVFAQLFLRMADRDVFEVALGGDPSLPLWRVSLAGGLAAAAALAFCPPWWATAAQAHPYSFHLAWLLLSALCLLRFGATGSLAWMSAFALLHGAGMSQASAFVGWAPVFFLYAVFVLWGEERLAPRTFLGLALLGLLPAVLLLLWNANEFSSSPGAAILGSDRTFWWVFRALGRGLVQGVYQSIDRTFWIILVGLSVAPWLTSLLVGRRALNGEGGIAMGALHLAIAATTLTVVLDLKHSPWRLVGGGLYPILPYAMTALSVGYLVAVSLTTVLHLAGRARERERPARVLGPAVAILSAAGAILLYAAVHNAPDASPRAWAFLPRFADATLDDMEGREWLVTPGIFDANLVLRAQERGQAFHPINLADPTSRSTAIVRDALPDIGLRNTAEIGTSALLHEWLERRPDAPDSLAFAYIPHLWQFGSFADLPNGIVFVGAKPEVAAAMPLGPVAERVRARLDTLQPLLDAIPTNAPRRVRIYAGIARGQASMAGNNAAFLEYMTIGILPKHLLEGEDMQTSDYFRAPVGTGPYKLERWDEGQAITLVKNENYFLGAPNIDTVVFKIVEDDNVKALQLKSGELNMAQVTPKDAQLFEGDAQYAIYRMKTSDYRGILFNFWNPYWQENKDIIPAINYAIDREAMIQAVLLGQGDVAYGPLQRNIYNNPDVEHYDYNPEKAIEILESIGCERGEDGFFYRNGEKISFPINCRAGDQVRIDLAQIASQQLKEVGIDMQVEIPASVDWGTQYAFLIGWGSPFDADDHTFKVFGTDQGNNYSGYSNADVDAALLAARSTFDSEERAKAYADFQVALANDPAYTFFCYIDADYVVDARVKGITPDTVLGHHGVGIFWNVAEWTIEG